MDLGERIAAFEDLGKKIQQLNEDEFSSLAASAKQHNPWFTPMSVKLSLEGIAYMLDQEKLKRWLSEYSTNNEIPKLVGVVMAGNIPLVGFHDLLTVLMSGHFLVAKPSSDDAFLMNTILDWLVEIEPRFKKSFEVREKLNDVDAVIATGSDNTARYFEYYFKDIPHIIRKNRTSVAVLEGHETAEELTLLADDIYSYFGLGCRNVSKIFTPEGYDLREAFPHFETHQEVIHHNKYRNNYDYYKSIYLVNKTPHLDTGFSLVLSTDELVSPISVLYHQKYDTAENLGKILASKQEKIQCIVGKEHTPFGQAQKPELWDYADNVDVLAFLNKL